jgi:hypothetical protein
LRSNFISHRKSIIFIVVATLFLFSNPLVLQAHSSQVNISDSPAKTSSPKTDQLIDQRSVLIHNPAGMKMAMGSQKFQSKPTSANLSIPAANYDEQLGLTFAQNSTAMSYNVTAVEQTDPYGYGPAYLLNGLTDKGDWYQAGLSFDWPFSAGGYVVGFNFNYEVFNSTGQSVFPSSGGGGVTAYSGSVNPGDIVLLSLYLSGGQIFMYSKDWNTSSVAYENYGDQGAKLFLGLSNADNLQGFFSGAMTEMYRVSPFYGQESKVIFTDPHSNLTSGTMWIDELDMNTTLFVHASSELSFVNASQLQFFSSNGATIGSDSYQFIAGETSLFSVTLSFAIKAGGTGYNAPSLIYYSNGTQRVVTLGKMPTTYYMDNRSSWSANNILQGSNSMERWISIQSTSGIASSSRTQVLVYDHQFVAIINSTPAGDGTTQPSGVNWFEAGTPVSVQASGIGSSIFTRWTALTPTVSIGNYKSSVTNITVSGPGSINAVFGQLALSLPTNLGKITEGAQTSLYASLTGTGGTAGLSTSLLPAGVKVNFSENPALLNMNGTLIPLTINVSPTTPAGDYNFTIFANSAQDSDFATYSLVVVKAVPLTFDFLVNGDSGSSPVLNYTFNGIAMRQNLSGPSQTLNADYGSIWTLDALLPGSNSTERWIAMNNTNGTAMYAESLTIQYFQQYSVDFGFHVVDGSIPPSPPFVNFSSLGVSSSLVVNGTKTSAWLDTSSAYSYSSVLVSNTSSIERWPIAPNQTERVLKPGAIDAVYYHQIKLIVAYNLTGGGSFFTPPVFTFSSFGVKYNQTLYSVSRAIWADAGSSWSVPKLLVGSNQNERWTTTNASGTARLSSMTTVDLNYAHQYFVRTSVVASQGGTVKPGSGWYAANSTIAVSENPITGWRFIQWEGSISVSNGTVWISRPTNLSATFYPGLSISAPHSAEISYYYGSVHGTLQPGASTVIYAPPGTSISVNVSPASIFYTMNSWRLGNNTVGTASSYSLVVSSPASLTPEVDYNYYLVVAILGVLFGAALSMLFILRKRSSYSMPEVPFSSEESELAEIVSIFREQSLSVHNMR